MQIILLLKNTFEGNGGKYTRRNKVFTILFLTFSITRSVSSLIDIK